MFPVVRTILTLLAATMAPAVLDAPPAGARPSGPAASTHWSVRTSQGFDALCAINLLSNDPYYLARYPADSALWSAPRYAKARAAAIRLRHVIKEQEGGIISAFLTLIFSGGPDSTLQAVLAGAREPAGLKKAFASSSYWNEASWKLFERVRPDVIETLEGMQEAGFERDLADRLGANRQRARDSLQVELDKYDVLGMHQRLLGRAVQSGHIEVVLLYFSKPHGIRIQGSRFLTNIGYPSSIVLRNATHEALHPPFPGGAGEEVAHALALLSRDPIVARVVTSHNRSLGYNSISGLVEEDIVQALEQIVSEDLNFAVPASARWRSSDDGMHLLAAGLHHLIRETDFPGSGMTFGRWLRTMASTGQLGPAKIEARMRAVVGDSLVRHWKGASAGM